MTDIRGSETGGAGSIEALVLMETRRVEGVEYYDDADEPTGLDATFDAIQVSGAKLGDFIRSSAATILAPMKGLDLDEITIEFSVGVEGMKGVPFIASAKGSASIKVTAKWTREES